MINKIDVDFIKTKLDIRPDGCVFWINTKRSDLVGKMAGNIRPDGYVQVEICGKRYFLHRLIWTFFNGDIPIGMDIDHINCIKNDNRLENLRLATPSQNKQNKKVATNRSLTGVLGVSPARRRFVVRIQSGETKIREYFNDINDAKMFYINKKRELHEFCTI